MTRFLHSSSTHKDFLSCPQKFLLNQDGAERGPSPENFTFGIAFHLVMQDYVDHCVAAGRRTDVTVIGDFIDAAVRKSGLSLSHYDELTQVVRGFLAVHEIDVEHSLEREGGIAFNEHLEIVPWSNDFDYDNMKRPADVATRGVMFRCKPDHTLVFPDEDRLLIDDYKTDIFVPSQSAIEQYDSRFNEQARKMAWSAWRGRFKAEVVDVRYIFARYTAYGRALTRTLTFTRDAILEIEEQEMAKIGLIEGTTDFPAIPGDKCSMCSYRNTACPLAVEAVTDDIVDVAKRFIFERVRQEERRERVKEVVAGGGWTGELGALRLEFEQGESQVPDMEKVWHELQNIGHERPWALMSLSNTAAKGLLEKEDYEHLVKVAYDPEITVRFNLHQKKDVLIQLAVARGIPTQTQGKNGMKDKTVAQLAADLAGVATDYQPPRPMDEPVAVDLATIEELA
ncbi:MAG TPA: PD-(D/E)XK nuclease family protein [Vicinamibacterales bacterium]|nr:PD-(D/E)XK nuclease family protein [Vicinamibacterales bacterium]